MHAFPGKVKNRILVLTTGRRITKKPSVRFKAKLVRIGRGGVGEPPLRIADT